MRVLPSLFAVCLVAGCGSGAPPETPAGPGISSSESLTQETAPATGTAVEVESDVGLVGQENPLIGLLEQDIPYGEGADGNLLGAAYTNVY